MDLTQEFVRYSGLIIFLIPLGAVGVWRWSVWLIKKLIALFYVSPVKAIRPGSLAIVTPVYNENPEIFETALYSWLESGEPNEIIAVIDYTDKKCIEVFKRFAERHKIARLVVTEIPGKRPALADGVKKAKSEFVALVDSDTIWSGSMKDKLLSPFADPEVGGVGPRQDVYQPDTLAKKLFQIHLSSRYFNDLPFMAAAGDALTCLSGRTAVYRRSAILNLLDKLVNEKFWGEPVISGDDKTLTRLVQGGGWKTKYIHELVVYTPGFPKISSFLRQLVRWSRNSWRSDLQTLSENWVWKRNKILALHMLDRFVQPFTLLLGPVYFVMALSFGYWKIALIIFIWWMISRPIKIYAHIRRYPPDILLMPIYVAFTFVTAVIKLYALFTLNVQGWITRWHEARLKRRHALQKALASFSAVIIITVYFFGVGLYRHNTLEASALKAAQKKIPKVIASIISQEPRRVAASELAEKKDAILKYKEANSSGIYLTRLGDTLPVIRAKFNLPLTAKITYENNAPVTSAFLPAGRKIVIPASELHNPLNAESLLTSQFQRKLPAITFNQSSNTIFVKEAGSIVTLSRIRRALLANKRPLEETSPGEWILRSNLYIGKNVTLVLDKSEVTYLKLKSDASGHIWLRSQNGNILISNTKISSWDEGKNGPDLEDADGRSYVTAKGSGRMDVVNSDISYLGYVGLPRRGGPFGGSYGLSWKITSRKFQNDLLTGSVIGSSIHNNYFGIYTFGATGVVIKDNKVFNNVQYGIDPHDDSNNFLISNNEVFENGNHGIILSKRCFNNEISQNTSRNNKLHGIMLDRSSSNNIVKNNLVFGNTDGMAIYESKYNLISNNKFSENKQGVRLNKDSSLNYFENNLISSNRTGAHIYGGANQNYFVDNIIKSNDLGISMQDAAQNVLYDNLKPGENKKEGSITVDPNANEIK